MATWRDVQQKAKALADAVHLLPGAVDDRKPEDVERLANECETLARAVLGAVRRLALEDV